jgi:shikimate dehydrogenase
MMRAAVLGRPIGHSLSPVLHHAAYASLGLDWRFDSLEVGDDAGLRALLERCDAEGDWAGLALTMPLKKLVLPLLDEVSSTAAATGAANTVLFSRASRQDVGGPAAALSGADVGEPAAASSRPWRAGDNTDVLGIVEAVREAGIGTLSEGVVLGGGATACSAVAALGRLGAARAHVVVRSMERAADVVATGARLGLRVDLVTWADAAGSGASSGIGGPLVISTVPAQASDAVVRLLAGVDAGGSVLLDVAYDPWPTPVADAWERRGGTAVGGFAMLLHQAVEQVRLMTGQTPSLEVMRTAGLEALAARRG